MKARIRGTNDPFQEITGIEIDYAKYDPEVIEFENDFIPNNITIKDKHWQDVRERAAIAAMQGIMDFFGSIDYNRDTIAKLAVEQSDALIEELKKK